jgi:hypothetical protein
MPNRIKARGIQSRNFMRELSRMTPKNAFTTGLGHDRIRKKAKELSI